MSISLMLKGESRKTCMICVAYLYHDDPAEPLSTAGEQPDDLDHDPSVYLYLSQVWTIM